MGEQYELLQILQRLTTKSNDGFLQLVASNALRAVMSYHSTELKTEEIAHKKLLIQGKAVQE